MLISCLEAQAAFPDQDLLVKSPAPGALIWDCHHGTTFILRVGGLTSGPSSNGPAEAGIRLVLDLAPPAKVLEEMEKFAGARQLPLIPPDDPPPYLTEKLTLAACHVPKSRRFIFSEEAALTARPLGPAAVELRATGGFRSAPAPSQETDLILHLEQPAAARLLSYLFSLARKRGPGQS